MAVFDRPIVQKVVLTGTPLPPPYLETFRSDIIIHNEWLIKSIAGNTKYVTLLRIAETLGVTSEDSTDLVIAKTDKLRSEVCWGSGVSSEMSPGSLKHDEIHSGGSELYVSVEFPEYLTQVTEEWASYAPVRYLKHGQTRLHYVSPTLLKKDDDKDSAIFGVDMIRLMLCIREYARYSGQRQRGAFTRAIIREYFVRYMTPALRTSYSSWSAVNMLIEAARGKLKPGYYTSTRSVDNNVNLVNYFKAYHKTIIKASVPVQNLLDGLVPLESSRPIESIYRIPTYYTTHNRWISFVIYNGLWLKLAKLYPLALKRSTSDLSALHIDADRYLRQGTPPSGQNSVNYGKARVVAESIRSLRA
jgi:hypothetical protein